MEAGIVASSWEFAKKRRHNQMVRVGKSITCKLEIDEINVPLPRKVYLMVENIPDIAPADYVNWNDARELEMGGWELDGREK